MPLIVVPAETHVCVEKANVATAARRPAARTNSLHILYSGVETFPVRKTPVPRITAVAQRPSRDGDRIPVTQYQNSIVDRGCCSQLENCPREVARPSG